MLATPTGTPSPSSAPPNGRVPSEVLRGVPDVQSRERRAPTRPHPPWLVQPELSAALRFPDLLQVITYRLADSLPATVLIQMDAELRTLPPERQAAERANG